MPAAAEAQRGVVGIAAHALIFPARRRPASTRRQGNLPKAVCPDAGHAECITTYRGLDMLGGAAAFGYRDPMSDHGDLAASVLLLVLRAEALPRRRGRQQPGGGTPSCAWRRPGRDARRPTFAGTFQ